MDTLTTVETAARLGVKPATVYAYVSRGLLKPTRSADGRTSTFDRREVERMAARGRKARGPDAPRAMAMVSALTLIEGDRYYYRGLDAIELAEQRTFEEVAAWLWTARFEPATPWVADRAAVDAAVRAQRAMGSGMLPVDRIRLAVTAAGTIDPLRYELAPESVVERARRLIAAMVESLPLLGDEAPPGASLARRLWPRLTTLAADRRRVRALEAALVLLADHELPVSTVGVRLAASTGAHLYAVVSTGLGIVDGPRHGGASLAAEDLLGEVLAGRSPADAVGDRLRRGERIPGFGQPLYPGGDPRAATLLEMTERAAGRTVLKPAQALLDTMTSTGLPARNIDFALAVLARATDMVRGAGELLFAVARTAGWVAHALEEYASMSGYRPRAIYVGPQPSKGATT